MPAWCCAPAAIPASPCKGPDGTILLNRDLKAGDTYQVPNTPGVTMATSNAGAVEVDLDGVALGRAGAAATSAGPRLPRSPVAE